MYNFSNISLFNKGEQTVPISETPNRHSLVNSLKPHSHCVDVATVYPDAGQPVYRDAPGHIS